MQWRGSAAGKIRRQARVGVTDWVGAVGEEILGGVVLGVWSTQLKRGWSGLSTVARNERGGAAVRGRRGCRGWSSRRWRSGRGWSEEAALDGPRCSGRRQHGARRSRGGL
jgi:hypothetical protein